MPLLVLALTVVVLGISNLISDLETVMPSIPPIGSLAGFAVPASFPQIISAHSGKSINGFLLFVKFVYKRLFLCVSYSSGGSILFHSNKSVIKPILPVSPEADD